MSQEAELLAYLKMGNSITQLEAISVLGSTRLAARIKNLRDQGYDIVTETEHKNGKKYARYWLKREVKQLEMAV